MSSAEEPLIAASETEAARNSFVEDDNGDGEAHSAPRTQLPDASPALFIWLLAFSASISGLLFGCKLLPSCTAPRTRRKTDI